MTKGTRVNVSELSSIDTALLLAGVLYAKQYFDGASAAEASIRALADTIVNRVDWTFMARGTSGVLLGWKPDSGFNGYGTWVGYNEAMLLYVLGWAWRRTLCPPTRGACGQAGMPGKPTTGRPIFRLRRCSGMSSRIAGSIFGISRTLS